MTFPRLLLWGSFLLFLLQCLYYAPRLPGRVASHFGFSGEADGWSSRTGYLTLMLVLSGFVLAMFVAIDLFLPRMPTSTINLPKKDCWLAPERRAQTLLDVRRQVVGMGALTMLYFVVVNEQLLRANLMPEPRLPDSFLVTMILFGVILIGWSVWLWIRYSKVPDTPVSGSLTPSGPSSSDAIHPR